MSDKKNVSSELQGLTRILMDSTIGITNLVEAMHKRVVHPPFLPSTPIQHLITYIAGITYNNVRRGAQLIGSGIDKGLGQLAPILGDLKSTDDKEVLYAVLNGVVGDFLEQNDNPLEIAMKFRYQAKAIPLNSKGLKKAYSAINGKIFLMVHGSCMNDIQWTRKGHNHGTALAEALHKTPVYLHYNSGRHISTNGQNLNELIEELVQHWPVPVEELTIIGHSMGGLIARSAVHYSQEERKSWTKYLKKMIFLGTPHQGAPLERAGNYLDVILEAVPYAKPFARLGKIRSAGITDLRYGNLVDEDWQDKDRFKWRGDQRLHVPLPKDIECYSIAGITGKTSDSVSSKWVGDNMVSLKSALGQHKKPNKHLDFKEGNTWIAYEHNHLDLLSSPEVFSKLKAWLN